MPPPAVPSPKASSTVFETLTKLPASVSPQWPMSGIRTFSTPRPSGNTEKRFNVLRFDDSWHKEQVVIRSQGRLDETSFASTFGDLGTVTGTSRSAARTKRPDNPAAACSPPWAAKTICM